MAKRPQRPVSQKPNTKKRPSLFARFPGDWPVATATIIAAVISGIFLLINTILSNDTSNTSNTQTPVASLADTAVSTYDSTVISSSEQSVNAPVSQEVPTVPSTDANDQSVIILPGDDANWDVYFTTNNAMATIREEQQGVCIDVIDDGTDIWDIEVGPRQIGLSAGKSYILQFSARADKDRVIRVQARTKGVELVDYGLQDIVVGINPTLYELPFTVDGTGKISLQVSFRVGEQGTGFVCMQDAKIIRQ